MGKGNKRGLVGCMLFLILVTLTSCGSVIDKEQNAPTLLSQRKVEFMTVTAVKNDIEDKFEVDGRIYSSQIQKLSFKKTGKLSFFNAFVGKNVEKGELLAAIDISEINHKVKITKLKIEQSEIKLTLAENTENQYKIKEAEIALKIEKMELEKLNEYLNNSTLVSEVDGIISSFSKKDIGTMVSPNITLITIMDTNKLGIKFNLTQNRIEQLNVGDYVEVARENEFFETEIIEINKNQVITKIPEELMDNSKITYKIKVRKKIDTIKDAILVPKVGIYTNTKGISKVQVLEDGKIIVKNVKLGIEVDGDFQILEGIEEGEKIIVK